MNEIRALRAALQEAGPVLENLREHLNRFFDDGHPDPSRVATVKGADYERTRCLVAAAMRWWHDVALKALEYTPPAIGPCPPLTPDQQEYVRVCQGGSADRHPYRVKIPLYGANRVFTCDGKCSKAWGRNARPKILLSGDPDDYGFLPDQLLPVAPLDPETYEGSEGKPLPGDFAPNKWCVRECERGITCNLHEHPEHRDFSVLQRNKGDEAPLPASVHQVLKSLTEAIKASTAKQPPKPKSIRHLFHHLWTKAVGTEGYVKAEWLALDKFLERKGGWEYSKQTNPLGQ